MHIHYLYKPISIEDFLTAQKNTAVAIYKSPVAYAGTIEVLGKTLSMTTSISISTNQETLTFSWEDETEKQKEFIDALRVLITQVKRGVKRVEFLGAVIEKSNGANRRFEGCSSPCLVLQDLAE